MNLLRPHGLSALMLVAVFCSTALASVEATQVAGTPAPTLPKDLSWQTSSDLPLIADPSAVKGGTLKTFLSTYPLTLRTVGPNANTVLYGPILSNRWPLVDFHPNTRQPIPLLASHWAFGKDGRSVFYKLRKGALWSDGEPVTASDFEYILEFYRSEHLKSPWHANFYQHEISDIKAIDKHTLVVVLPEPVPDLLYHTSLAPVPRHFYKDHLDAGFVGRYNWLIEPNTGPYNIDSGSIKKGHSIEFVRKKNWWASDLSFVKGRFNVDRVLYKVIREESVRWQHFKKAQIDFFNMEDPKHWYESSKDKVFTHGYVSRLWFYTARPEKCFGIWLNTDSRFFKSLDARIAVHHALNVQKVIDTLMRGERSRQKQCSDGYGAYTNPSIAPRPFNVDLAVKSLMKAGYDRIGSDGIRENADGERAAFQLLYAYDGFTDQLLVLKEDMKKAGILMNLSLKDWSTLVKIKGSNGHEATYTGFSANEYGVPKYWGSFHRDNAHQKSSNNTSNLDDALLSQSIDAYRRSRDEGERVRLAHEIQARIHDQAVFVPGLKKPWFRVAYWRYWRFPKVAATKLSQSAFEPFDPVRGGLFWFDEAQYQSTMNAVAQQKQLPLVNIVDETYRSEGRSK